MNKASFFPPTMFCLHAAGQGILKATLLAMTTVISAVEVPEHFRHILFRETHKSKDQIYNEYVGWAYRGEKVGSNVKIR